MELNKFKNLELSDFRKTWIFDIDGTVLKHNGYKENQEVLLDGVKEFFDENIHENDYVLFLTHRSKEYSGSTEKFFIDNQIRFNLIIYDVPFGERILFNDTKPTGLRTSYGICLKRDQGL
jgi:FMN phosphatase YigB (HAD superfamily)